MPLVFGPSDDTASLIGTVIDITKWAQEYFQKPLSVNTIRRAICRCQLSLYHAKRKPYVNMVQKHRRVLWAKAHLKWTVLKWKSVLWSDESKFDILVGNHGRRVLRAKEEGDLPACYQRSVQNPASLMVWGVHKCIRYGQLARFRRYYECWKVVLGGMTKNLYHGIFQNYTGFTVYDGIYFFHAWLGVNHSF